MASKWISLISLLSLFLLSSCSVLAHDLQNNANMLAHPNNTPVFHSILHQMTGKRRTTSMKKIFIFHYANIESRGEFYGATAALNVYGLPTVKRLQSSSVEIWVANFNNREANVIRAGWHVDPDIYGDSDTHFFVDWTLDKDSKTGCINMDCKGFVLVNTSGLVPGYLLQPLSQYNGQQQFISLQISKDRANGDWWLHAGSERKAVGYWPNNMFTSLKNTANAVTMGGEVIFKKGDISPPMGSGHKVSEGEGKAASIKFPRVMDAYGMLRLPNNVDYYYDRPRCYMITADAYGMLSLKSGYHSR